MRGVSEDGEELNASMGEFIKTMTGVDLTDANGEFRSTYEVLKEIGEVWDSLDSMQQASLAEEIAGKNRANVFTSIMQNYKQLENAYESLKDSAGSSAKEQEAYMDSLSGRINALKESVAGLSIQMVNSDFLKGTIDTMTTGVNVVGNFIDTFGAMPSAITGTVGALTVFNSKFRETTNSMLLAIPGYNNLTASLKKYEDGLESSVAAIKKEINALKENQTEALATGKSTTSLGTQMIGLNGKLALTTAGLVATKVATVALQATMSMGLSLAISSVISLLSSMWTGLTDVEGRIEAVNEASKNLADTLESTKDTKTDLQSYEELRRKIDDINTSEEERKSLSEQLEEVKSRLYSADDQAYAIINNQNLSLERQLELLEKINNEKLKESAQQLEDKMTGGIWGEDESSRVDRLKEVAEYSASAYEELSRLQKEHNGETFEFKGLTLNLEQQNEMLEKYKNQMQEGADAVDEYNSKVELLKQANVDTDRTTKSLSDQFKDFYNSITESTKALDENTQAKENNANADTTNNGIDNSQIVADATNTYNESKNKVQELKEALEELNEEQAVSSKLISELADTYPDIMKLGSSIYDLGSVQEFLNQQIESQAEIQATAYENMIAYDNAYYDNKIKNNEEFMAAMNDSINAFVGMNNSGYEIDFNNYSNLNELKNGVLQQFEGLSAESINNIIDMYAKSYTFDSNNFADLQSMKQGYLNNLIPVIANWIATFTGVNADGYTQDLSQFNDLTEMKAYAISQLSAKMAELQSQWWETIDSYNSAVQEAYSKADEAEALRLESHGLRKTESIRKQMNQISAGISTIDKVFGGLQANLNKYEANFTGSNFNAGGVGSNSNSSNSNKGNSSSSSKDTEKQIADIADLTDRYYELENAITDCSNALSINKLLQDNTTSKNRKVELMKQEINLYQKQAEAIKNLNSEQKKEAEELKKYLTENSYQFDSNGNVTNRNKILAQRVAKANSLSGERKESYIAYIEEQESILERYTELTKNLIPQQEEEWQSLQNSISSVKDTIKEMYEAQLDVDDFVNRYYDLENAINDYANALSLVKLLQSTADDKEKIKLMKQEIDLYQKQAEAVKKLTNEQKKEAEEIRKELYKNGFNFDNKGNILDVNSTFAKKIADINSMVDLDKRELLEESIKNQQELVERYTELIKDKIPQQEEEWQSLQNSIADVNDAIKDLYKEQLDLVASQEKEIASMIEYYAQKKTDAKKEAVEKELELEKKRLEGLKKSLSEEKELYNKQIDEEDYEADLAKERNKLAEIQAEIDRLSMASDAKSKAMLQNLLKQYDEQQQVISEKIKEHQQQATNDRFDEEMELLDKELESTEDKFDKILEQIDKDLEEYLNPENLNNIIQKALKTGMVDIMGVTVDVQSAMADMIKETETGFINASTQIGNFIENLKEVKDLYGSINTIMTGSGLTANLPQNMTSRSIQVSVGDLIVQGNVDSDILSDIQAMMDRQANEIYKNINQQLNSR